MEHGRGAGAVLIHAIRVVAETGSTNADMLALARAGAEEGLWLRAERQTAGRGRQGRAWVSTPGNLHASTVVRLRPGDPPAPTLALVAAVALAEVVSDVVRDRARPERQQAPPLQGRGEGAHRLPLTLKWPNDLLLAGAKLSGTLLERTDDAVVIGFGVNLAHHPDLPDRPTTSVAAHGVDVGPGEIAEQLAAIFAGWLVRWRGEGLALVRERWLAFAHPVGAPLIARSPDGSEVEGFFAGLDGEGALLLDLADGVRRVIHAADVFTL